jgi:sulfur carrier protein
MITLRINGNSESLPEPLPLTTYLERRAVELRLVAIAHNGVVVPRADLGTIVLRDGDSLEIVRMVGGG